MYPLVAEGANHGQAIVAALEPPAQKKKKSHCRIL
jgi:hypothetical protein